jgi:hypothetical protein
MKLARSDRQSGAAVLRRDCHAALRRRAVAIALGLATAAYAGEDANRQFDNVRKMYDAEADLVWFIPRAAPEVAGAWAFYVYFGRGEKGKLTPLHDLATLALAKGAVVHFEGQRARQRLVLSDRQKQAIRDMLQAYQ